MLCSPVAGILANDGKGTLGILANETAGGSNNSSGGGGGGSGSTVGNNATLTRPAGPVASVFVGIGAQWGVNVGLMTLMLGFVIVMG